MALTREESIAKYGTERYTAWQPTEADADAKAHPEYLGGAKSTAPLGAPPSIDLPGIYKGLFDQSGISQTQDEYDSLANQLTKRQEALNAAKATINDNPWYSEATRVGRVRKLDEIAQNDMGTLTNQQRVLQDKMATAKADIETQLNIQTKQFDINSAQAQQAFQQFNTLLAAGALDNASGEDIASLTRATGVPSSMIRSAIQVSQDAKKKDIPTSIMQFDDGKNQGFAVINAQTGEVISKQNIAGSKPTKTGGGDGFTPTQERQVIATARTALAEVDAETNEDHLLSLDEYQRAVTKIMQTTGVDFTMADNYATKAFQELGYGKWGW